MNWFSETSCSEEREMIAVCNRRFLPAGRTLFCTCYIHTEQTALYYVTFAKRFRYFLLSIEQETKITNWIRIQRLIQTCSWGRAIGRPNIANPLINVYQGGYVFSAVCVCVFVSLFICLSVCEQLRVRTTNLMYLWTRNNLLDFRSQSHLDQNLGILQDSSILRNWSYFNNLARISRKTDRIFMTLLLNM